MDERDGKPTSANEVTTALRDWSAGDDLAAVRLMPLVYDHLREQARRHLERERGGHTLQPTALVHEAYMRLVDQRGVTWQSRTQFFAVAARMMRRVLLDHARARNSARRGGREERVSLDAHEIACDGKGDALLALDAALERLAAVHPRQASVVELKFFGGLEVVEIAQALQVADKTVLRDWHMAKLWLCRELDERKD